VQKSFPFSLRNEGTLGAGHNKGCFPIPFFVKDGKGNAKTKPAKQKEWKKAYSAKIFWLQETGVTLVFIKLNKHE
jgi:hypothetical protein